MKQLETFASFCGKTKLERPRDAFLASICKASLPPHYTLNVLKATPSTQNVSGPKSPGDPSNVAGLADHDIRHQVVAVGKQKKNNTLLLLMILVITMNIPINIYVF